jgi:hypothetical protein
LVVTGPWSREAAACLTAGGADGLTLNYARGFAESDLDFLDEWPVRRLDVLDRTLTDLSPIARLGASLECLSIQVAAQVEIDLAVLPRLHTLAAWWNAVEATIDQLGGLEELTVMEYDEINLRPVTVHSSLTRLTLKSAPFLETLDGVEDLSALAVLHVAAARELNEVTALTSIASSRTQVRVLSRDRSAPGSEQPSIPQAARRQRLRPDRIATSRRGADRA